MTYLEHNRGHRGRNISVTIIIIIFVAVILVEFFSPQLFPAIFSSLTSPFWRAEFSIENGGLSTRESLLKENQLLKEELAASVIRSKEVEYMYFENSELRSLMGKASTSPMILAAVLKRPPLSPYDELIIDAGWSQKLSTTSKIYAAGSILIGRVAEVFGETSKVILFSSPGVKLDVLIGETHIPGLANGRGGGSYEVELPRGIMVKEGDFVLASGLDSRPIGVVVAINSDNALPFQKIIFSAPVNLYQLRWVLVDNETTNESKYFQKNTH